MARTIFLPVLLCAGCLSPRYPGSLDDPPVLFSNAQAAILRDDWEDAAVLLGRFLREQPGSPYALQARYLLGTYYLRECDLEGARSEFTFVAEHAGASRLGRHARIRLGDTACAAGEYDLAASVYQELLSDARKWGDEAELLFKLGIVRQRQGRWGEADSLFEQVRNRFPRSVFARRAAEQLAVPRYFSLQVGAFRDRRNAEEKKAALERKGHRAEVCRLNRHGRPFWCVRIGSFQTREQAIRFKSRMRSDPDIARADIVP